MSNRPGGLGRGLAALIPPGTGPVLVEVPISAVSPNPRQPRGVFDTDELEELATSIADVGLLQPIIVRPLGDQRYELVAGERRLRASKLAGLTRIPAIVRETKEENRLKEALIENVHRVDLNPLEEAAAYRQLLDDFGITQDELSQRIGKSRPSISNSLRLLSLPPAVQRRVAAGVLSAGHAKALLALESRSAQERLAERVVAEGLSVRATEEAARLALIDDEDAAATSGRSGRSRRPLNAPGLQELEETLSDALQARVRISMGARRGRVQIDFASVDDLERIVGTITRGLSAVEALEEG
ncbi:MAG: ParB/RepB/Spo0J family partition protein [Actinobacteria bacterium]|nr:ParB/RepB/Spo0J family partition protein [Actinomycetota bacterium]